MPQDSNEVTADNLRTSNRSPELQSDALLLAAIESFLLSRRVGNCSSRTLEFYTANLNRFARFEGAALNCNSLVIQRHLTSLHEKMQPISLHGQFRALQTFFRWCVESGQLTANLMRGITMRSPKTLPSVPEDETIRKLLAACSDTFEGRRNKALVALLCDSGLRISEALRLRLEDVRFGERTLVVKGGKGSKDGVGHFGAETSQVLRAWLQARQDVQPEDFVFVDRHGRSLSRSHACHLLHKLSVRAGLPRKIGPHQLRHYAATSLLKQTGDLELVRQVLRHETLTMALKYARLTGLDVSRKFRRASPLDNLRAGR